MWAPAHSVAWSATRKTDHQSLRVEIGLVRGTDVGVPGCNRRHDPVSIAVIADGGGNAGTGAGASANDSRRFNIIYISTGTGLDSFTKTANPNSRQSSNLFRHIPHTKFSSRLPKHKFPVIWNSLSHDHHSIASQNIFKKTLKRSFLDNYTPVDHPCSNPLCPDCVTTP